MIDNFNHSLINLLEGFINLQLFPAFLLLYTILVAGIAYKKGDDKHIGFKWSFLLMLFGPISGMFEVYKSHPISVQPREVNNKDLVALAFNLTTAIVLFITLLLTQLYVGFLFIPFVVRSVYYFDKYNYMVVNERLISDEM